MLLPLWLFHCIFLSWWISCLFPSYQKIRGKSWTIWFVHLLQVIFDQSPNIRKTWTCEFVLSLNSWNLNLTSKRVHLPRSCQKKPVYRPWRRNEERRAEAVFCHTESRKKSQRSQKAKRHQAIRFNRVKENAMNAEAWEECVVSLAQWRRKAKLQHLVFPRPVLPIQVLTRPDPA